MSEVNFEGHLVTRESPSPMNVVPAVVRDGQLELPFVSVPLRSEWEHLGGGDTVFIAGIRPGSFEDATLVDPVKAGRGATFAVDVDVTEWLGNEQYAFVPYDAPADISAQLAQLANDLDSEHLRTQICVELDPASQVAAGSRADIWLDTSRIHLFDPRTGENLTRTASAAATA